MELSIQTKQPFKQQQLKIKKFGWPVKMVNKLALLKNAAHSYPLFIYTYTHNINTYDDKIEYHGAFDTNNLSNMSWKLKSLGELRRGSIN